MLSSLASSSNSSNNSSTSVTSMPITSEDSVQSTSINGCDAEVNSCSSTQSTHSNGDEITIKLKYLNDDLKIVKARTDEPIGDFKKYCHISFTLLDLKCQFQYDQHLLTYFLSI